MARVAPLGPDDTAEPLTRLIFHAEGAWYETIEDQQELFFEKLTDRARDEGVSAHLVRLGTRASRGALDSEQMHVIVGDAPQYAPYLLHAHPAHIRGFWYMDETGIREHSSIRLSAFHPSLVSYEDAEYFFNGVSGYMLRENISQLPQRARMHDLERAAVTVFCRPFGPAQPANSRALSHAAMIATAATTFDDRQVYVAFHGQQLEKERTEIKSVVQQFHNVSLKQASVHDLIAASDIVLTQNAAAGFEALMQRKPVVSCARCDYAHATINVRSRAALKAALLNAERQQERFAFAEYFYWHHGQKCLEPVKDEFADLAWGRIVDKMLT